ncbi:replication protein [Aeromonas veronii]
MANVFLFPDKQRPVQPPAVRVAALADGFTRIANELYDAFILADFTKNEQKVVHAITRYTYGFNKKVDRISDSQIAGRTGMSRQAVSLAKNSLIRMKVLVMVGGKIGPNNCLSEWDITECHRKSDIVRETMTNGVTETMTVLSEKPRHTKDTTKKTKKKNTDGASAGADAPTVEQQRVKQTKHTPFQAIVDIYHEVLPEMAAIRELTDARKTKIRNFWHKFKFTEERWRKYLEYIAENCRWMCESRPRRDGESSWKRKNLDFLVTERCILAVKEGRFDDE